MKCLFVIDMLNDFMSKDVYENAQLPVEPSKEIIGNVEEAVRYARENEIPVFYLNDAHDEEDEEFEEWGKHCVKGTEGAEVVKKIKPETEDYIIEKKTYDGFANPELEENLQDLNIDKIYEAGVVSNICVLKTGKSALKKGYDVSVIKECIAGLKSQKDGIEDLKEAGIELISLEGFDKEISTEKLE